MNIRGLPRYVRQPSKFKDQQFDLIFTYPILVNSDLQKYQDVIRDFISVAFLNQIKTSNFLQVVSSTIKEPEPLVSDPAAVIYKALNNIDIDQLSTLQSPRDTLSEQLRTREVQEFINNKLQFLKAQLENNMIFSKLKPSLTMITINTKGGLLTLPMIVGTHPYFTDLNTDYYIMLIALSYGIKLDSQDKLDMIEKMMELVTPVNYYSFLFTDKGRKQLLKSAGIDKNTIEKSIPYKDIDLTLPPTSTEVDLDKLIIQVGKDIILNTLFPKFSKYVASKLGSTKTFSNPRDFIEFLKRETISFILGEGADKKAEKIKYYVKIIKQARDILLPLAPTVDKGISDKYISVYNAAKLSNLIRDESKATIAFWKIALDRNQWDRYVGVSSTRPDELISHSQANILVEVQEIINKTNTVFGSYVSANVSPVLSLMVHILECDRQPIDINASLNNYLDNILKTANEVSEVLWPEIQDYFYKYFESYGYIDEDELDKFFSSISKMNDLAITSINAAGLKEKLPNLNINHFNFTIIETDPVKLIDDLNKSLDTIVTQVTNQKQVLFNTLVKTFNNSQKILNILKALDNKVIEYTSDLTSNLIDTDANQHPILRNTIIKMIQIKEGENVRINIDQVNEIVENFVAQLKTLFTLSISNLVCFFYLISFISYLDDMIKIVQFKMKVTLRDTTDFPNYCLVIPFYVLENFYEIKLAEIFKKAIRSVDPSSILNSEKSISGTLPQLKQRDPKKVVEFLSSYLGIPNLIAIDEKSKTVYYKFMFMSKAYSISLNTIKDYIRNQKDILSL